ACPLTELNESVITSPVDVFLTDTVTVPTSSRQFTLNNDKSTMSLIIVIWDKNEGLPRLKPQVNLQAVIGVA
ncbi:MAG: hypothetical protein PHE41_00240, partial [Eubacteriales bacterium]|nr:hypothetical protein [Eubacteriales bacterium]